MNPRTPFDGWVEISVAGERRLATARDLSPAGIGVDPPGIVASQFFGFAKGYAAADTILPGRGYWVKLNQEGRLVFSSGLDPAAHRITIIPSPERPPPAGRR